MSGIIVSRKVTVSDNLTAPLESGSSQEHATTWFDLSPLEGALNEMFQQMIDNGVIAK